MYDFLWYYCCKLCSSLCFDVKAASSSANDAMTTIRTLLRLPLPSLAILHVLLLLLATCSPPALGGFRVLSSVDSFALRLLGGH